MTSIVQSRANHYETLGLAPSASSEEIAAAFAKRMGVFRSFGDATQIGIAYEVLRNPTKRRAYDESLGLGAPPPVRYSITALSFRASARLAGAEPAAIAERASELLVRPEARPETRPEAGRPPQAPVDRAPGSFIAASLREPTRREPVEAAPSLAARRPDPQVQAEAPPGFGAPTGFDRDQVQHDPGISIPWSRPAAVIGGLVLAVALVGAWAGSVAGNYDDPQTGQRAVKVALPPPTTSAIPATASEARRAAGRVRIASTAARPARRTATPKPAAEPGEQLADAAPAAASSYYDAPAGQDAAVSETSEARAVAASMPLPESVVARTIERIGYSCGKVASTTAGGGVGVYTVNCTSGQSYQAKPVNGRYRFRRLRGH